MVSTEVKLWFLSSLEYFWPYPQDTLSKVALFFEKMHKVFKNKAQRCSTPLSHTLSYLCVLQYSNAYMVTPDIDKLMEDKALREECLEYVARPGK